MSNSEHWRARLREAVRHSGRKHSVIARNAGIAPATLSRILTGTTRRPSFDIVAQIAYAAGESVGWILEERAYALSYEQRELLRRAAATIRKVIGD